MWTYEVTTGWMSKDGAKLAKGYSGAPGAKNDPYKQEIHNTGPLPEGSYTIAPPVDTPTHGPCVMWLTPDAGNEMFGRSSFGIHGDSIESPGTASEGCIILPRFARDRIAEGLAQDNSLQVVPVIPIPELNQWEIT